MTITDFRTLSITEQLDLLYMEGVFLAKRKVSNRSIILYQLDKWYVEIFYVDYRNNVAAIICSDDPDVIEPYLRNISINEIFR